MNCKNCKTNFLKELNYCSSCGAKVITQRLSIKNIWNSVAEELFGWDNKYFFTVRNLIIRPEAVLGEYINGVRKKYMQPFAFFAVGLAISMFVFNTYSDKFIELSRSMNEQQYDMIYGNLNNSETEREIVTREEFLSENENAQKQLLKYFNLFGIFFLPMYALSCFLIFRKPHNFAEHLIINCFLQGIIYIFNIVFFLICLITNPLIYWLSVPFSIMYYLYAYKRLNKYTIGKALLKLLIFLATILIIPFCLFLLGMVVGFVMSWF